MKLAAIGAVLITLPALVAFVFGIFNLGTWWGPLLLMAAGASLFVNTLPFVVVGVMSRKARITDIGH